MQGAWRPTHVISGPGQDFYQVYFSGLGPVIEEIEEDLRGWVRDLMWTVSGDSPLEVPAAFLGAEYDVATWWGAEAIARAPEGIPNWLGSRVLPGAGHWLQQERAEETNAVVLEFLAALRRGAK